MENGTVSFLKKFGEKNRREKNNCATMLQSCTLISYEKRTLYTVSMQAEKSVTNGFKILHKYQSPILSIRLRLRLLLRRPILLRVFSVFGAYGGL